MTINTQAESRIVTPSPMLSPLEGHRPGIRTINTGPAGSDNIVSRPLGYRVKAVTFVAPGSLYKSGAGANTDSVYIDVEEINVQSGATPTALSGPHELPAGTALTIEEVDPGWIHYSSPTANQRLMVSYGGPSTSVNIPA